MFTGDAQTAEAERNMVTIINTGRQKQLFYCVLRMFLFWFCLVSLHGD